MSEHGDEDLLEFLYLSPLGVAQVSMDGEVQRMSPAGSSKLIELGYMESVTNLFGLFEAVDPEMLAAIRANDGTVGTLFEERVVAMGPPEGKSAWLSFRVVQVRPDSLIIGFSDVTQTMLQQRRLAIAVARMQAIFDSIHEHAIFSLDSDGLINSWNKSGERMFEYASESVRGLSPALLMRDLDGNGEEALGRTLERARRQERATLSHLGVRQDGTTFPVETTIAAHIEASTDTLLLYSVVVRDVTKAVEKEERLADMAFVDELTGLTNRRRLVEVASESIDAARQKGGHISVIFVDADHFKDVNDTHGHDAGDAVLRSIADALKAAVRTSDLPARFGGEEFVVLLPGTPPDGAMLVAERLRATIEALEIEHEGQPIPVTVSVGVASTSGEDGQDFEALLAQADEALYAAKEAGRNRVVQAGESD